MILSICVLNSIKIEKHQDFGNFWSKLQFHLSNWRIIHGKQKTPIFEIILSFINIGTIYQLTNLIIKD